MFKYSPNKIHTLSRGILTEKLPSYFDRAKGAYLFDESGKQYIDLVMGKGSVTLGHGNERINNAVYKQLESGNQFSIAPKSYHLLAERLTQAYHDQNSKCIFSKNGSDAVKISIRVARAYSKKKTILFSGYHSWQDEFTSCKWPQQGVFSPDENKIVNFNYDLESLERLFCKYKNDVAAILITPEPGLIEKSWYFNVKKMCEKNNSLLIADEVKNGYHIDLFGLTHKLQVEADIVLISKGMANGHAVSAVLGKDRIMDASDGSIIFGTYFFEATALSAALEVLNVYEEENVVSELKKRGKALKDEINSVFKEFMFPARLCGEDSMPFFLFNEVKDETLFFDKLIEKGIFAFPNDNLGISMAISSEILREIKLIFCNLMDELVGIDISKKTFNPGGGINRLLDRKMIVKKKEMLEYSSSVLYGD